MKPRVAWFSDLTIGSTSAYWTDVLVPRLRSFDVTVFSAQSRPDLPFLIVPYLNARSMHEKAPFDLFFYQLEDGKTSSFTRIHLALMPGVVLFHDFLLSDDGPEPILNSPWEAVVGRFHDRAIRWPLPGEEFERRTKAALREAACAGLALFSSVRDHLEYKRLVSRRLFEAESLYLPHPVEPIAPGPVPGRTIVFCGTPRIEHRAHKVLEALEIVGQGISLSWLIDAHEESEARALAGGRRVDVRFVLGRTPGNWRAMCAASKIALHPHFSAFGQTGPYLPISLASGCGCVVSDFGGSDHLPESAAIKVRPGITEAHEMALAIEALLERGYPNAAGRIYAEEFHSADTVAEELDALLASRLDALKKQQASWEAFEKEASHDLVSSVVQSPAAGDLQAERAHLLGRVFNELGWA